MIHIEVGEDINPGLRISVYKNRNANGIKYGFGESIDRCRLSIPTGTGS